MSVYYMLRSCQLVCIKELSFTMECALTRPRDWNAIN